MRFRFKTILMSFLLPIIFIMFFSFPCCSETDRTKWQPPEKIMDVIGVKKGMRIGEAGAGGGYFTFPLAYRIGDSGKIYANDISETSLALIRGRANKENLKQLITVLGEVTDPLFPEKNLDMIVLVYVLHCLEKPVEFMNSISKYLKKDGRLVIIEQNTTKDRGHYPSFMSNRQILDTIQKTSFSIEKTETFLPRDTIYIYNLKKD